MSDTFHLDAHRLSSFSLKTDKAEGKKKQDLIKWFVSNSFSLHDIFSDILFQPPLHKFPNTPAEFLQFLTRETVLKIYFEIALIRFISEEHLIFEL